MGERAVDALAHQRMHEHEPIARRPHQNVSHQVIAGILRFLQQNPEMSQAEQLAENRGGLDGATIPGGKKVGPGEHDALDRCRQVSVGEVAGAAEQLFEKQRIAARTLDALGRKCVGVDELARYGQRVGRRERRKVDGGSPFRDRSWRASVRPRDRLPDVWSSRAPSCFPQSQRRDRREQAERLPSSAQWTSSMVTRSGRRLAKPRRER